jgi:hypothetical protein
MLTKEDCLAFCNLDEEMILAIAGRVHLPVVPAAELANFMLQQAGGTQKIKQIILEDITAAETRRDFGRALKLKRALNQFSLSHPDDPAARQRT